MAVLSLGKTQKLNSNLMAQTEPKIQSLSDASQTALHALLSAIDPEGVADGKSTSDVVTKLSENLSELVGPEVVENFKQGRNGRGELVNEEGLPIIDITEPVDDKQSQTTETLPTSIVEEPFTPLSSLPTSARARRNEQVNRILDYLEEEERQEERKEKQREFEEKNDMLQKRKIQEAEEKANIKATRELQKKMGRALLQNIGEAKEKERQEQEAQRLQDEEVDKSRSSLKKKTVAFVDVLNNSENDAPNPEPSEGSDWGDVTLARLRASKRPTLLSQSLLDKHPMKMSVVERFPVGPRTLPNSPHPGQTFADSDDESDPAPESESSDTATGDEDDDESIVLEQEVDFDFVQHQRQIVLEYHRKRNKLGQDAAEAIMKPFHADDTPLESTPDATRESSKPAVSQFRATRIASAYSASAPTPSTSASTSLGASVVPASSSRTIQRALRTGKLDPDGRLVGGEADSASEDEDPALQEVLEVLKKGEVYNLGPDGNHIHTIPPRSDPWVATSIAIPSTNEDASASKSLPPSRRPQTSKFKPSRPAEGRLLLADPVAILSPSSIYTTHEPLSPSITPVSHAGRSSPKLEIPQAIAPQVYERKPLSDPASSSSFVTGKSAALPFSMIVDSPSFPLPQGPQGMPETVIPSPSAPPTHNTTRPDRPPAVLSSALTQSDKSQAPQSNETSQQAAKTKKISRFKAERS